MVEGDASGGLRFGIDVRVTDPEAEAEASGSREDALPADPLLARGGRRRPGGGEELGGPRDRGRAVGSRPDRDLSIGTRLIPLMALRIGRVDVARTCIGGSERGLRDSPGRIAELERRLAAAHPEYGPLQRSSAAGIRTAP